MRLLMPVRVGPSELGNRLVLTAHGSGLRPWSANGFLPQFIAYQARRVAGGMGMNIVEGLWLGPATTLAGHSEAFERFTEAMRQANRDVRLVLQLSAWGGQGNAALVNPDGTPLQSLNGMQSSSGEPSLRMDDHQVIAMIELHAGAARLATQHGFDGVELHAAHGYLLHQAFSPWGNGRGDRWGEPLALPRAVIAAVRAAIGPCKILGLRMALDDDRAPEDGGQTPAELAALARQIAAAAPVDYWNVGFGSQLPRYGPRTARSYRHEPGADLQLSAGLRRALEGTAPVVGVGRILTPAMAEAALVRGDCDLVGVTRGQIADPDFLAKLRAGSATRIRRCVGANECADAVLAGSRLSCIHNPNVGRESMPPSRRSTRSRRLLVIGAGPAGLKAAELAAREGHRVTIADAAGEPGGLLRHIRVTAARELYAIVDWLRDELDAAEVELKLDTPVDAGFLRAHRPEAVILATGRQLDPLRPPAPAPGTPPVLCSFQALYEDIGHRVLVVDRAGDMEAALVAEALVTRGVSVVIATSLETFAPRAGYMMRRDLMPLLRNAGSEILVDTDIQTPLTESVTVVNRRDRSCREIPADAVVLVDVPKPDRTLEPVLRELAIPFHAVGDALTPRGIGAGMRDADRVVRSLG